MSVLTKEKLMEQVKNIVGENTDDATLAFLDDINDTLNDYDNRINNTDNENWKKKYEDNDKAWRDRYRNSFFNKPSEDIDDIDNGDNDKPLKYEDLFKEN